jgi:hypothetical protein
MVHCCWCNEEVPEEEYNAHWQERHSGKNSSKPLNQNSAASWRRVIEVNGINERIGKDGSICAPLAKSPIQQYIACTEHKAAYQYSAFGSYFSPPEKEPELDKTGVSIPCIVFVIRDLVIAERVARRQYFELLQLKEILPYMTEVTHIRDEEFEHERILKRILTKLGFEFEEEKSSE